MNALSRPSELVNTRLWDQKIPGSRSWFDVESVGKRVLYKVYAFPHPTRVYFDYPTGIGSKRSCQFTHWSFVCLVGFLTSSSTTRVYRGRVPRLTFDNLFAATHQTERGDLDFCLSWSHYTDT